MNYTHVYIYLDKAQGLREGLVNCLALICVKAQVFTMFLQLHPQFPNCHFCWDSASIIFVEAS